MRISLQEACQRLLQGGVVAIPTETVYGLAAALHDPTAIGKIFAIKKRPADNPLIIHIAERDDLRRYTTDFTPEIDQLTQMFWPGALTLVVPIIPGSVPAIARANLPTAAFRQPKHPLAHAIVERVGPLVAPSANLSGRPSPTRPEHVEEDFGAGFPVVDGGPCDAGMESTILIQHSGRWWIGRLGALAAEVFQPILGYEPKMLQQEPERVLCPGSHYRHYAPRTHLTLGRAPYGGTPDVVVGFSDRHYPNAARVFSLGNSTDVASVSRNVYNVLRQLDNEQIERAWVDIDFPALGLWKTISERLTRAAMG